MILKRKGYTILYSTTLVVNLCISKSSYLTTSREERGARAPMKGQRCTAPVGGAAGGLPELTEERNARAAAVPPSVYLNTSFTNKSCVYYMKKYQVHN